MPQASDGKTPQIETIESRHRHQERKRFAIMTGILEPCKGKPLGIHRRTTGILLKKTLFENEQ